MLTADVPLTGMPQRITVAGGSGSGKTTLCNRIAELMGYPRVEIDSLHHGPRWTRRESFVADVDRYTSGPQWVIELQYREVRPLLLERADTLLWLDYPTSVQMTRLMRRTLRRRLLRQELWNGNQEPPLRTFFTDEEHIMRWGWRTRNELKPIVPTVEDHFPSLTTVRLGHPREAGQWIRALAEAHQTMKEHPARRGSCIDDRCMHHEASPPSAGPGQRMRP